jgi:hypothetical protein
MGLKERLRQSEVVLGCDWREPPKLFMQLKGKEEGHNKRSKGKGFNTSSSVAGLKDLGSQVLRAI